MRGLPNKEIARSLGIAEGTVDGLRADVKKNLAREVKFRVLNRNKAAVMDALVKISALDLPKALVQGEVERMVEAARGDLKQRGLLDDVLVIWCTEFGRMPTHQVGTTGRDHNPDAYTTWMMGAGVKGGISYGATDDFGYNIIDKPVSVHDLQATILHQMGIDHKALTYKHQGRYYRLTDVFGQVVSDLLA